ncbi:MAG: hypothetical protein LBT66_07340 [Methanobrevibacter sp.]|nr:hypothetical protein [Candidatus Methanovirga meridionalis]
MIKIKIGKYSITIGVVIVCVLIIGYYGVTSLMPISPTFKFSDVHLKTDVPYISDDLNYTEFKISFQFFSNVEWKGYYHLYVDFFDKDDVLVKEVMVQGDSALANFEPNTNNSWRSDKTGASDNFESSKIKLIVKDDNENKTIYRSQIFDIDFYNSTASRSQ